MKIKSKNKVNVKSQSNQAKYIPFSKRYGNLIDAAFPDEPGKDLDELFRLFDKYAFHNIDREEKYICKLEGMASALNPKFKIVRRHPAYQYPDPNKFLMDVLTTLSLGFKGK